MGKQQQHQQKREKLIEKLNRHFLKKTNSTLSRTCCTFLAKRFKHGVITGTKLSFSITAFMSCLTSPKIHNSREN